MIVQQGTDPDAEAASLRGEIEQLREALATRDVIGQAKGIVRVLFACSDDESFAALSRLSQDTNLKLREVAAAVVEAATTGTELPEALAHALRRALAEGRIVRRNLPR